MKTYDCPKCKAKFSIKDYDDSIGISKQMIEGGVARTNPLNAVTGGISMARHAFAFFTGESRKDACQGICENCKSFYVHCPYCETLNPMSGKIDYEFQPETCKSCKKGFDVYIFNA
jgi:hypothetical protein